MTMSRRELFELLRRPRDDREAGDGSSGSSTSPRPAPASPNAGAAGPEAGAPAFSLDDFYAARAPSPLPVFAVKPAPPTPTTGVGSGRVTGVEAAAPSAPATAIPDGLAPRVLPHRCLATTSFCSVCVERCPIEGAIVVTDGRPRVDADRCDGCGRCIGACPAPILAFELIPRTR